MPRLHSDALLEALSEIIHHVLSHVLNHFSNTDIQFIQSGTTSWICDSSDNSTENSWGAEKSGDLGSQFKSWNCEIRQYRNIMHKRLHIYLCGMWHDTI
jgi:hypothetical protein